MKDYSWIQHDKEGLYYAELQELIQTIDWTVAWQQLSNAMKPILDNIKLAAKNFNEYCKAHPELMDYALNRSLKGNFKGKTIKNGLTYKKYLELTGR